MTRSLRARCEVFKSFLKSTVVRQCKLRRSPVRFIPFGSESKLLTLDVYTMHKLSLKYCPKSRPKAEQIATIASMCLLWTAPWARILRRVPAPCTQQYLLGLRSRLKNCRKKNVKIYNKCIQGSCSKSVSGNASAQSITKLCDAVKQLAVRAVTAAPLLAEGKTQKSIEAMQGRRLARGSYLAKFFAVLLHLRGFQRTPSLEGNSFAIKTGTEKPLAHLLGLEMPLSRALGLCGLRLLEVHLRQNWRTGAPAARMPPFKIEDLCPQLCAWEHHQRPRESADYAHAMLACVQPE